MKKPASTLTLRLSQAEVDALAKCRSYSLKGSDSGVIKEMLWDHPRNLEQIDLLKQRIEDLEKEKRVLINGVVDFDQAKNDYRDFVETAKALKNQNRGSHMQYAIES